ncbi:glycosyltransferase [Hyphomicrobium facile]|uniref:Glycosyltransferase involved in cell wall bisynthesis n=1 Tax=Hyphomicrobium facile TaxID=51670 RepID=A0A1I7NKJ8_9HYPH|nr:glycosyltransferase [Hyphomicrobium facile]SFV35106.1 Glycosyltransferase involved in cell wall bisynthesis [Hyphomicrobium facile]
MSNGISVVICAHNSAERLPPTIEALARCKAEFPVEIIIVDNNSSDDTAERAQAAWNDCGNVRFAFTIIREPQAGLSYARRAGTRAASFDVILFCDDDNWLAEDYLINAVRIMQDPTIGAAGGCSTPANPESLPPWFYTFSWGFAVGVPISRIVYLPDAPETERQVDALWGAGLVTRRDLIAFLYTLPGFPVLSGRKGEKLLSGEDIEISACVACAGYKLIFNERLQFRHAIAPSRLTTAYAKRLFASFEEGFAVTGQYTKIITAFDAPLRAAAVGCARIAKHILLRRLTRESFLSLLAALRLPGLMTSDQRQIYRTVQSVRAHRSVPHKPVRPALRNVVSENPA